MANMRVRYRSLYPQLAKYLPAALQQFHGDAIRLGSFRHFSSLTESQARRALTMFSTQPWIEIDQLGLHPIYQIPVIGLFEPSFDNRIKLDVDAVNRFEQDYKLQEAREAVLATVLHEMVHWGLHKNNIEEVGEAGREFELAVWGRQHKHWFEHALAGIEAPPNDAFVFPVSGRVGAGASYWGKNIRAGGTRSHYGIDIFNELGTAVHAVADGTVLGGIRFREGTARRRETGNYGQMVDIDHGNELLTRYAHLESVEIRPGMVVRQGQRIGTLGASGTHWGRWLTDGRPTPSPPAGSTPPHLHFEVRKSDGEAFGVFDDTFDPASFFDFLPNGEGARDQPVVALTRGRILEKAPQVMLIAESVAPDYPTNFFAYPNLDFGPTAPRGLRNNNPGNLKKDGTQWAGLRTPERQLDPVFFQFIEMKFGIRAATRVLNTYRKTFGIDTLAAIADRWAPMKDNNEPDQYARNVLANSEGRIHSVDSKVNLFDPDDLFGVIRGIIAAENGPVMAAQVADDTVWEGIQLATTL